MVADKNGREIRIGDRVGFTVAVQGRKGKFDKIYHGEVRSLDESLPGFVAVRWIDDEGYLLESEYVARDVEVRNLA